MPVQLPMERKSLLHTHSRPPQPNVKMKRDTHTQLVYIHMLAHLADVCVLCFGCHVLDWIHQRLRQKTSRSWFLIHYAHIDVVMMMGFLLPPHTQIPGTYSTIFSLRSALLYCSSPTSIIIIICRAQLDFHSFINPPSHENLPSIRPSVSETRLRWI
jgi:hypothetical protein